MNAVKCVNPNPLQRTLQLISISYATFSVWERSGLKRETEAAEMMKLSVWAMDVMQILLSRRDGGQFNDGGELSAVDLNSLTHSFSLIVNYLPKPHSAEP